MTSHEKHRSKHLLPALALAAATVTAGCADESPVVVEEARSQKGARAVAERL